MSKTACAACSGATVSHFALWLSNSGDVFALGFARFRNDTIITVLSRLGEWALARISGLVFIVGRLLRVFTLHDDITKATSERSRVVWEEARARGIPMQQVYAFGAPIDLYRITVHGKTHLVDSLPIPAKKQKEALHIDDKISFKKLMRDSGIPSPESHSAGSFSRAKEILARLSRVCIKPRSGSNGLHTYPHVSTEEELAYAFKSAKQLCHLVSVEEHLEGNVCRATCVDGKLVGFLESIYPTVIGDGALTIRELIANANAARPEGVAEIELTSFHEEYIARRGHTPESVLPSGERLPLTYRAGASSGGRNREYGRNIDESFIPVIERAAALTELPVVGFDLIITDPLSSADSQKWGFIEANSLPWINLHHTPFEGAPVNVAARVWDLWD